MVNHTAGVRNGLLLLCELYDEEVFRVEAEINQQIKSVRSITVNRILLSTNLLS